MALRDEEHTRALLARFDTRWASGEVHTYAIADGDNDPMKDTFAAPTPVVLGIDDLRPLPRATRIARTSREGVQLLEEHRDSYIDELWLDHDLGGDDTIMPVVTLLEEAAFHGRPFRIGAVFVHSANPIGAETVVRSLAHWNYRVQRARA